MTRTTPDGVFAEAARAELLHRVRAGSAPARRPFVVEAVVAVAVVAIAVAVVLGVQQLHAGPIDQGPPAAPVPTASSSTPVPPTPTATPSTTGAALIGSPGARVRTEAEIRAWGASEGLGDVMIEQDVIQSRCMQQHGFVYDPIYERTADLRAGHSGMTAAHEAAWDEALDGPETTAAYDWRTAGCRGLAVHQTGQDDAH